MDVRLTLEFTKCIDLTRLPLPPSPRKSKDATNADGEKFEYSSREVKPAVLLLQDLLRAHSTFLLHHDSSLSALFVRVKRPKFTSTLDRYWDLFLSTWNVLLHGNPVRDIFGGIRVAASGELGIGVGEEDRGSGEREVLEGLVGRIDGLVDLVVSKFGDSDPDDISKTGDHQKEAGQHPHSMWLGAGQEPDAEDGAVFLGVGALSRKSLRDITQWMEDMYTWGENAYGVLESPKAARRATRTPQTESKKKTTSPTMQVPPSLFATTRGSKPADNNTPSHQQDNPPPEQKAAGDGEEETGGLDKYMDYLKLGYGKYWTLGGEAMAKQPDSADLNDIKSTRSEMERRPSKGDDMVGHFLIGLTGEVEEDWIEDPEDRRFAMQYDEMNARTMVRTLTVELETQSAAQSEKMVSKVLGSHDTELSLKNAGVRRASFDSQDQNKTQRLRVVVYVAKPFMFTFLFAVRTESLALEGLYRSLHHQVAPLRKLLARSTAYRPERPDMGKTAAVIYDLVWDPKEITVHSTIPNIPGPIEAYNAHDQPTWSRVEALNTHMQILNLWSATRADISELERTCKTSRGWWIVWNRILERNVEDDSSSSTERDRPSSRDESSGKGSVDSSMNNAAASDESLPSSTSRFSSTVRGSQDEVSKEIFLLRKASDHAGHGRSMSLAGATSGSWADGASRLAQGIGVDTRKYIEGLLSLNR